ncbi:hybrid sensor histidine kinase/response regulator [Bacteroidia bacterium]|nr:hybrid sensor histidine kinase/response regulator [Bacteroidia bacterium]
MKSIPLSIIAFIFLISPATLKSEESYYFRRFGVENGLPQNTVSCILQDKQGFMWFGTKDGLSRYDGYTFKNFKHDKKNKNSIGNNFIRSLYQDEKENIWVGTDAGVYIYNPSSENFSLFDLQTTNGISIEREVNDIKADKNGNLWFAVDWQGVFLYKTQQRELIFYKVNTIVNAWCICIDREDNVWIGTHGGELNWYDRKNDRFETIPIDKENVAGDDIYRLYQDNYNDLLIGTANGGVKKLSLVTKQIKPLFTSEGWERLFVRDIIRKSDTELCIGSESGIYIYNTQSQTLKNFSHELFDPYSLSDNAVYSLYKDREGGLWIGTYFGGVNYYPPQHTPFERFYPQNKKNTIHGKRIREFQQDQQGNLWIGTEDEGLNYYNPQTKTFKNLMPDETSESVSYHNIHGLLADGDKLWVGTFTHGVNVIDIKTQKVIRRYKKTEDPHSLCDNSVFSIYKDESGNLWFGTIYGLAVYNPQQDNFTKIAYTGDTFIYDIFQSYDGILWFASFNRGLFRYNPRNDEWKVFVPDTKNKNSLGHNKVISIYEDSKKRLWVTTEGGGICKYNNEDESFTSYTTKEGLPNDVVYKILEDNKGRLWLTTNNGLSCFNPENNNIKTFTIDNGLLGDQFNYKSGYKTPGGMLYFGCLNGFIAFDPLTFTENDYIPPVVITDFHLFNKETKSEGYDSLFKQSVNTLNEIRLTYKQSSFSIDFAALSYMAPGKNKYAYILEGFENKWTQSEGTHSVTYSNIPPGNYIFRVKGSNNDGLWNEQSSSLKIHILPPFYRTKLAYTVYSICLLFIIFQLIISYKRKMEKRNKRKLEIFENEKNKELYNAKIAFFTNIAHEIRTPLSLIKGPLEHILTENVEEPELKENLEVIEKNTNRLLDLSNQLLDFRKMESRGFQLNYINTDIKQLIQDVFVRFKPTVTQKNLSFQMDFSADTIRADVDREAFTKILSNLLTNATKHAESRIQITADIISAGNGNDNDLIRVEVSNDGSLIPKEMSEKIFEPFFQIRDETGNNVKSGTGLGLPLARSLAELHHGKLCLNTSSAQLNSFIMELPVKQASSIVINTELTEPEIEPKPEENPFSISKPTLLLAEDDRDMRHFLYGKLKTHYHVMKVSNGKIAMDYLQKENIDIVITDIMMPEMDGLQLCKEIKSNVNYSHIPVIMLTAKAGLQSRIEGLEAGADAYVEKPFAMEHLFAQISNLFMNRNKVKQAFINSPVQSVGSIALTKSDEIFLEKVTKIIHKNLSESSFNVDLLAEDLHMSRSSLHRKIKGISELTPNDFIQLVRLKKAAEYLQEGSYRINEIGFLVGFSSSSYFSKSFKKQFGISPKEFI